VEVTPESFRYYWEERYIDDLPRTRLVEFAHDLLVNFKGDPAFPYPLSPSFAPRDALGLFIKRGTASFRRVVIEPLGEQTPHFEGGPQ
jgi:hypothetical protein